MAKRFGGKDGRSILCPKDSHGRNNISTVPNSVIEYGQRIQGSKRLPPKYDSSNDSPERRVPVSTSLGISSFHFVVQLERYC